MMIELCGKTDNSMLVKQMYNSECVGNWPDERLKKKSTESVKRVSEVKICKFCSIEENASK